MKEKSSKIPLWAIIISTFSLSIAAYSAHYSFLSFNYIKNINKAAISFLRTDLNFDRKDNKLVINFSLVFKNTGNEPLVIDNKLSAIFDFDNNKNDVSENIKILNTIYPDVEFSQHASKTITINDSNMSTSEAIKYIKNKINLFIIVRIDYSNDNLSDYEIYYIKYTGGSTVSHLSLSEYKKIESKLPPDFILENSDK